MATKKIRKNLSYERMNRCSLAQIVEMIEAEKRRKQRLEWYLQEVMLEKETLMNEPARLAWHSRCLILPTEPSPVTVTSLPSPYATAGASHLADFVFNTHPSSPSSASSPPFSPPSDYAASSSPSPQASPAQFTSSSSTSPLSSSWEGDWRHGLEEERNFDNSDDLDQTPEAREQWEPGELWWQTAFPDSHGHFPAVAYGRPF